MIMQHLPRRTFALLLCLTLLFGTIALPTAKAAAFSDVSASAWYADDVQYVSENGIMSGVSGNRFDPNGTASRAMVVTTLYRIAGSPDSPDHTYADVPAGIWCSDAISWAAENHVVDGIDANHFAPNQSITREQIAVMLYRYAEYWGLDTSPTAYDISEEYQDASTVSSWAYKGMNWAVTEAILSGVKADTLAPHAYASRSQVARLLHNFIESNALDLNDPPKPAQPEPEPEELDRSYFRVTIQGKTLELGTTAAQLTAAFGQPDETFHGTLKGDDWAFNTEDPANFFMVSMLNGKVYRIYLAAEDANYLTYHIGDVLDDDVIKQLEHQANNDSYDALTVSFQRDKYNDNRMVGVTLTDRTVFPNRDYMEYLPRSENDTEGMAIFLEKYETHLSQVYNSYPAVTAEELAAESRKCLLCINAFRAHLGIQPLIWSDEAAAVALQHSEEMAEHNYFSHDPLDGSDLFDRLKAQGIQTYVIGENCTRAQSNGLDAFNSWLQSEQHRLGMTGFTYAGIGAGFNEDSDSGYYWTMDMFN